MLLLQAAWESKGPRSSNKASIGCLQRPLACIRRLSTCPPACPDPDPNRQLPEVHIVPDIYAVPSCLEFLSFMLHQLSLSGSTHDSTRASSGHLWRCIFEPCFIPEVNETRASTCGFTFGCGLKPCSRHKTFIPRGKLPSAEQRRLKRARCAHAWLVPARGLRSAADGSICCDMYVPEEALRDRREVRHAVAERLKLPLQAGPRQPQLSLLPFCGAGKAAMSRWSSGCAARVQMSRMEWSVSPCCRVGRLECLGAGPFAVATCSLQSALVLQLSA